MEYCKKCGTVRCDKVCQCGSKRFTNNIHGVPKKFWAEWSEHARNVFMLVYEQGKTQRLFLHPKTEPVPDEQWSTTAFNFAVAAAEATDGYLLDIEE